MCTYVVFVKVDYIFYCPFILVWKEDCAFQKKSTVPHNVVRNLDSKLRDFVYFSEEKKKSGTRLQASNGIQPHNGASK